MHLDVEQLPGESKGTDGCGTACRLQQKAWLGRSMPLAAVMPLNRVLHRTALLASRPQLPMIGSQSKCAVNKHNTACEKPATAPIGIWKHFQRQCAAIQQLLRLLTRAEAATAGHTPAARSL